MLRLDIRRFPTQPLAQVIPRETILDTNFHQVSFGPDGSKASEGCTGVLFAISAMPHESTHHCVQEVAGRNDVCPFKEINPVLTTNQSN